MEWISVKKMLPTDMAQQVDGYDPYNYVYICGRNSAGMFVFSIGQFTSHDMKWKILDEHTVEGEESGDGYYSDIGRMQLNPEDITHWMIVEMPWGL
jgi:hypothetical protein